MTNPGNRFNPWWLLWLLILSMPVIAQDGAVMARLASDTVTLGDTVRLDVVAINAGEDLDTRALEADFAVLGNQSSRQVVQVNGQVTTRISWVLELEPLRAGRLAVPPVRVGAFQSTPLSLTVNDAPAGAARDVFVELTADTLQPWLQSQVILTIRVYTAVDILDGALSSPEADALVVTPLGSDRRDVETRDGRSYQVTERRFAAFPQQSGELVIEPILLTVSVGERTSSGAYAGTRKLRRRSEPLTLSVRPREAGGSAWWLPAQHVEISDAWSADVDSLRVGQPVTRTITVQAVGVGETQLPPIEAVDVDGVNLYPDQPLRRSLPGEHGLAAEMQMSVAVIPTHAGTWELPAMTLDWFDVTRGESRTATLPAVSLSVAPAEPGQAAPVSGDEATAPGSDRQGPDVTDASADARTVQQATPTTSARSTLWPWLAGVFAFGWLSTALAWGWRSRQEAARRAEASNDASRPESARLSRAWAAVRQHCRDGDREALAQALLAWAALHWPDDPPRSLVALADRVDEREAAACLAALDAGLYRSTTDAASAVATSIKELPEYLARQCDPTRVAATNSALGNNRPIEHLPAL